MLDFDSARRERRKPSTLRAFDHDWTIPASRPVAFVLLMDELRPKSQSGQLTRTDMYDLLRAAVGEDTFAGMVDAGLEDDDVSLLFDLVTAHWAGASEDGDEGEAQAPEAGAGSDT